MKSLTVEIICNDLPEALSLQGSIIEVAGLSGANVESTSIDSDVPIQINWDDGIDFPDAEEKPPEGQDDSPHHVENLGDEPTEQRSSEVNPGDNPALTASQDVINACAEVCEQQYRAVSELNEAETDKVMSEINPKYTETTLTYLVDHINNVDYYREVTQALHALELRTSGYGNDTINQRLKAEYPDVAKLLRM